MELIVFSLIVGGVIWHIFGANPLSIFKSLVLSKQVVWTKCIEVVPRGWGFQILMASLEKPIGFWVGPMIAAFLLRTYASLPISYTILMALFYPMVLVCTLLLLVWQSSWYGEASVEIPNFKQLQDEHIQWNNKDFKNEWYGTKIPIETAIEAYMDQKIDFRKGNEGKIAVFETLLQRHKLFTMQFTKGHIQSIFQDLLRRVLSHNSDDDKADVSDVYNKGNDWYGWFLCDKMLYSVGLWEDSDINQFSTEPKKNDQMNATMSIAQTKKLDKICQDLCMMKPGMDHLDLGCGWGALILHASGKYKVKSQGVTLSQEQANYIASLDKDKRTKVHVINAWNFLADAKASGKKFDVITCVEMSEHIGIRDYQLFCHAVRDVLKDDGIFYLQIAGLRRSWQYEDLVWGLFMNKYIFPGADASCPLGWDIEQLERSGFEVHSVDNCGVHYGLTIFAWYNNWIRNKDKVVEKYGERRWRNWAIFLGWSTLIAWQGSSTVWMISMTKQFPTDVRTRPTEKQENDGIEKYGLNRLKYWVDKKRDTPEEK